MREEMKRPAVGAAGVERVSGQDDIKFTSAHVGTQANSSVSDGVEKVPLDITREGDGGSDSLGVQEGTPVTEAVVPNCGASGSRGEGVGKPYSPGGAGGEAFLQNLYVEITSPQEEPVQESTGEGSSKTRHDGHDPRKSTISAGTTPSPRPQKNAPRLRLKGNVQIGGMRERRTSHSVIQNPDLGLLLLDDTQPDTILTFGREADITILDADLHHFTPETRPCRAVVEAAVDALSVKPDASFTTHGGGLKLIFVSKNHRERALRAAAELPSFFEIETLHHTRHPGSIDPQRPDARCGPVRFHNPNPDVEAVAWDEVDDADKVDELERLGLAPGGSYPHEKCPIDPGRPSSSKAPVVVLDHVVYCHVCAAKGVSLHPGARPGVYPLIRRRDSQVVRKLARFRVHWWHARYELRDAYPNLGDRLLEEMYRAELHAQYGDKDPRVEGVFHPSLSVVCVEGRGCVDAVTGLPLTVCMDLASSMPACQTVSPSRSSKSSDGDGDDEAEGDKPPKTGIDRAIRAQIMRRIPPGYTLLTPVQGLSFKQHTAPIFPIPPVTKSVPKLLPPPTPSELESSWARVEEEFPGIVRPYLQISLAAVICAERSDGRLPMLLVTGPSGSGKNETLKLAGTAIGVHPQRAQLADAEELLRRIGTACEGGARMVVLDEFAKSRAMLASFSALLVFERHITFRRLFRSADETVPCSVPLFLTSTACPEFLVNNPEFQRRVRSIRLPAATPEWFNTAGGSTIGWRDRAPENALALDRILAATYALTAEKGFGFDAVADELIGARDAEETVYNQDACRELYRFARGEYGCREMLDNHTFRGGWIDATAQKATTYIAAVVPFFDPAEPDSASRNAVRYSLEAISWPTVLGISEPTILLEVRIKGRRIGFRFREEARKPNGAHLVNEQLPPIPGSPPPVDAPPSVPEPPTSDDVHSMIEEGDDDDA